MATVGYATARCGGSCGATGGTGCDLWPPSRRVWPGCWRGMESARWTRNPAPPRFWLCGRSAVLRSGFWFARLRFWLCWASCHGPGRPWALRWARFPARCATWATGSLPGGDTASGGGWKAVRCLRPRSGRGSYSLPESGSSPPHLVVVLDRGTVSPGPSSSRPRAE